jgi:hypothetical protein
VLIAEKDAPRALQALQGMLKVESVDAKQSPTDIGIILTAKNPARRGRPNPHYVTSASRRFQSKARLGDSYSRTTGQFPLESGNFLAARSSGLDRAVIVPTGLCAIMTHGLNRRPLIPLRRANIPAMGPSARPSEGICKRGIVDEMLITNCSSSIASVIITRLQTVFSYGL